LLERRVRAVVELRRSFEASLRTIPEVIVYPSDANFLLVRVPNGAADAFDCLLRHGVLVKDVSRPGPLERCLRITVGTSLDNERCVRALQEHLHALTRRGSGLSCAQGRDSL
jgi:histidinol-phosphate aminotransferase